MVLEQIGSVKLLAYAPREDGVVLVKFSGVFKLAVEVDGDRGLEVMPPTVWTTSEGWKTKEVDRPTVKPHGDGKRWRQTFVLDPLTPAATSFELKPLRYRDAAGAHVVEWKPVAVKVVVQIADADVKNLRRTLPLKTYLSRRPAASRGNGP